MNVVMAARDLSKVLHPVKHIQEMDLPVDDHWRKLVRDRCAELGVDQAELATWVGSPASGISYLIGEHAVRSSSKYVERVSAAVGVPLPLVADFKLLTDRLLANVDQVLHAPELQSAKLQLEMLCERVSKKRDSDD